MYLSRLALSLRLLYPAGDAVPSRIPLDLPPSFPPPDADPLFWIPPLLGMENIFLLRTNVSANAFLSRGGTVLSLTAGIHDSPLTPANAAEVSGLIAEFCTIFQRLRDVHSEAPNCYHFGALHSDLTVSKLSAFSAT